MAPADTDVVCDAHIALLPSADADIGLVLRVDDIENLVRNGTRVDRFEDYEVTRGFFNVHNVEEAVVVRYLEGENLLA
jgi:hypothetical protein